MKKKYILFAGMALFLSFESKAQLSAYKPIDTVTKAVQTTTGNPTILATEVQPKMAANVNSLPTLTADVRQGVVYLNWITNSENKIDHFTILRSTDGSTNWTELASVKAIGNLEAGMSYRWSDASPLAGLNYYQIQLVGRDGKASFYSDRKTVNIINDENDPSFTLYPNPSYDGVIKIAGTNSKGLKIINSSGADVTPDTIISSYNDTSAQIDISQLGPGTYYLRLNGKVKTFSKF